MFRQKHRNDAQKGLTEQTVFEAKELCCHCLAVKEYSFFVNFAPQGALSVFRYF